MNANLLREQLFGGNFTWGAKLEKFNGMLILTAEGWHWDGSHARRFHN